MNAYDPFASYLCDVLRTLVVSSVHVMFHCYGWGLIIMKCFTSIFLFKQKFLSQ